MATSKDLKAYVKLNYGFVPDDCWIAHAKAICRTNGGKIDVTKDIGTIAKPCAPHKRTMIYAAMRDLGMV